MIGAILGIGIPIVYLTIGFAWSRHMLPKWWEIARKEWEEYGVTGIDSTRSSVKQQWFWKAITWPGWMIAAWVNLDRIIDGGDPELKLRKLKEREREIERLERELGVR